MVRDVGVFRTFSSILCIPVIYIYSLLFLRYMVQPIRKRFTTLSCFETSRILLFYLRVFLHTHTGKPVSDQKTKFAKLTNPLLIALFRALFTLYKVRNICK